MEQFVTVEEAAEILDVTRRRAYQLVQDGTIPKHGNLGRQIILRRADVERLAEQGWPGRRPKPS